MKLRSHWLSKGIVAAIACISLFFGSPASVSAATDCKCFCGDSTTGAINKGNKDSQNECAQTCADSDLIYAGCFTDEALYPAKSNLCWTIEQCESYPIDIAGEKKFGTWGGQSPYCAKEMVTNAAMGYCHGPLIPVTLNVPVLGVTEVYDLGTYINTLYKYAIPASAIFAVLLMTLAGFQYMTAGGDKGAVTKAKDRMANSAIGIVLLMSVYAIAYLIDPRLTRFNELRPPLVKEAILLNDKTSCESLFSYGYCIDGVCPDPDLTESLNSGGCGIQGIITGEIERRNEIVNPPKVGEKCAYSGCSAGKACIVDAAQRNGTCVSCADVSNANPTIDLKPSKQICSDIAADISRKYEDTSGRTDRRFICEYDNDGVLAFLESGSSSTLGASECVSFYSDNKEYVDCGAMRERAKYLKDPCILYEDLNADTFASSGVHSGIYSFIEGAIGGGSADTIEDIKEHFSDICEEDLCGVAKLGTENKTSCDFIDTNFIEDAADMVGLSFADNYGCVGK